MGRVGGSLLAGLAIAFPAAAAPRDVAPVVRSMLDCRAIIAGPDRLACYDSKVAAFDTAQQKGEVVVADKAQIQESKKALFGFGAVRLPIFGSGKNDEPASIQAHITGAREMGYGKWEVVLDNGMRWREIEAGAYDPRPGQEVTIHSAALGGYFMKIAKQTSVRAMRVE